MDKTSAYAALKTAGLLEEAYALLGKREMTLEETEGLLKKWNIPLYVSDPRNTETEMPEADFSALHRGNISGSSAAKALGWSHFPNSDPVTYAEIFAGRMAEPSVSAETQAIFDAGHREEPRLFEDCEMRLKELFGQDNVVMYAPKYMMKPTNANYDWALVNLDGLAELRVEGEWFPVVIELKTFDCEIPVGREKVKNYRAGKVPQEYFVQVQFYMHLTGIRLAYVYASWARNANGWALIPVQYEEDFCKEMFLKLEDFIFSAEAGLPVDASDYAKKDVLFNLYLTSEYGYVPEADTIVTATDEYEPYFDVITDIGEQQEKNRTSGQILVSGMQGALVDIVPLFRLGNNVRYEYPDGRLLFLKLKPCTGRTVYGTFDEEGFVAMYPDEASHCMKDGALNRYFVRQRFEEHFNEFFQKKNAFDEEAFKAKYPEEYKKCCIMRGKNAGKFDFKKVEPKFPELYKEFAMEGKILRWEVEVKLYDPATSTYRVDRVTPVEGVLETTFGTFDAEWLRSLKETH